MELPKKIGIWGLGVVGQSLIRYFGVSDHQIGVMDKKAPGVDQQQLLEKYHTQFFDESQKEIFFNSYQIIIPSAGIDLRPYARYKHKFINELDVYAHLRTQFGKKTPIIAITGSLGKTSITHLLSNILSGMEKKVVTGGNIGVGLMDVLQQEQEADYTVLELSSFQLENTKHFAPDYGVITNIFANHLDRHGSFGDYLMAKEKIFSLQANESKAFINADLAQNMMQKHPEKQFVFFSEKRPHVLYHQYDYYYLENDTFIKETNNVKNELYAMHKLPSVSFLINWIAITAIIDQLGLSIPAIQDIELDVPDHRLQFIATKNGIDFYDDSKSTVMESTIAALERLSEKPSIALIGGVSKGVCRRPLFEKIKPLVKAVICFGAEAQELNQFAKEYNINSRAAHSLQEAFKHALTATKPGDQIVLSPAGASYDLFKDYKERGIVYQKMVEQL